MFRYLKEETTLLYLPRLPLVSSYHLNWEEIYVSHHLQPSWQIPEHCAPFHTISFNLIRDDIPMPPVVEGWTERVLGGQKKIMYRFTPKSIALVPANVPHQVSWEGEGEFAILLLEPDYIARIAYECVDPDRVELMPHFDTPDPLIYQLGMLFLSELRSQGLGSRLYIDSLTTMLAVALLRKYSIDKGAIKNFTDGLPKQKLKGAIDYINDNLAEDFSLKDIAAELKMSYGYLTNLFKKSTGMTVHQYVTQCRIRKAKQLLTYTNLSLIEVAQEVGFSSRSHFSKIFCKQAQITPKVYRYATHYSAFQSI
jgi:AraC family transcriptional regulator